MSIQSNLLGKIASLVGDAWLVRDNNAVKLESEMAISSNDVVITTGNVEGILAFGNGTNFKLLPNLQQLFQSDSEQIPPENVIQSLDLSETLPAPAVGEGLSNLANGGKFILTIVNFVSSQTSVTSGFESLEFNLSSQNEQDDNLLDVTEQFIPNDPLSLDGQLEGQTMEDGQLTANGVLQIAGGDNPEISPANYVSSFGEFSVDAEGLWQYELNNATAQQLAGNESIQEQFDVMVKGRDGELVVKQVIITIVGEEDSPVIEFQVAGDAVQEDVVLTTQGEVSVSDVDNGDNPTFVAQSNTAGTYGSFSIDAAGNWSFALDNAAVQGMETGDSVQESFEVEARTADGESTNETVIITINGTEDAPTISGDVEGDVAEDSNLSTSGTLSSADVDTADTPSFTTQSNTAGTYGSFSINAAGDWIYELDNNSTAVQALGPNDTMQETFTVTATTNDGETVSTDVVVDVTGANDSPEALDDNNTLNIDNQTSVSGNVVTENDSDPEGDELNVVNHGQIEGKYGTLTLEQDGDYHYELNDFDLSDGLVSYWNFDEVNNNKVEDLANEGSKDDTLTLKQGATVSGGTVQFDGDNDIAELSNSVDINLGKHDARSISLDFQADDPNGGRQVVYEEGAHIRGLTIYIEAGELHVVGWNLPDGESDWNGTHFSFDLADSDWHNVTLTLDGTTSEFSAYLDGAGQTGDGSSLWQHSGDVNFGATGGRTFYYDTDNEQITLDNTNSKHAFFDGQIDNARIYDRALNETEVNILANRGQELVEEFDYQISDGSLTDDATLTINLTDSDNQQINQFAPVNAESVDEDNQLSFNLQTTKAYDASAQNGSVVINDDGTLDYNPTEHYSGQDQISYKVIDALGNVEERTIDVDVIPVADVPILNSEGLIPLAENSLVNGSFESDVGLSGKAWGVFDDGEVEGWTLESGSGIEVQRNTITNASDGNQYIELDSHDNSTMSQTVAIDPDHFYEIQFDYMPRPGVAEASNAVKVYWNGELIDELSGQGDSWITHVYSVEGGQSDGVLTFEAAGKDDSLGGFIDNVSLTDLNSFSVDVEGLLVDTDGSETLSLTVDDLPEGAKLSDGNNEFNGNGVDAVDITSGWDLANLQLEVPNDVDYEVSVTATATESENGDTASTSLVIATSSEVEPLLIGESGNTVFHFSDQTIGDDSSSEYQISNFSAGDVIELSEVLQGFDVNTDDINDYLSVELTTDDEGNTSSVLNISTDGDASVEESIVFNNVDLSHGGVLGDSNAILNSMLTNQNLVIE